ncbi:DUF1846 domain-containing protein [Lederbergia wuyishanensis]|uniref:Uncharacterized protein (UPF0371 family) n=1 Tax=Lederbergia wuyishanensis TaxID=1347903 RepID=A0ABU0D3F1_9BACI|nr:DUF1846 domain-containing protein [Lederbergia wuyishanensis]MCJ8007900.1 DUF1846 domain-containing protein [Lederbergia wuyishanensis]MDQ0342933.1 uncharacterized protein (UPF0371 family) [Lederbergia wuyishanensis]
MKKVGFDSEKYLEEQSSYILERVQHYDKLYLEFGGKLIGDKHAKRVLPGFDEDAKMKLLATLKEKAEIIICVYASDIERKKIREDYGITYDQDVLRLIDEYRGYGISVNSVLITRYQEQPNAKVFMAKLERSGINVYTHRAIEGYPTNVEAIIGEEGFAKNPYIKTTKPIIVVTGPGPASGKLATCLNQMYHEHELGNNIGYAKFETFPVWNLPLKHPVNIAYEAATVDLKDVNMIDNYHYEAYGEVAVNYNRDIETFPVIKRIIEKITGKESVYQSPTDMGVNRLKSGIIDDQVVREAAKQEIIRRSFAVENEYKKGSADEDTLRRMQVILEESDLKKEDRVPVLAARNYAITVQDRIGSTNLQAVIAIELPNGEIITGRTTKLMDASAAAILNGLKLLANIADEIDLLTPMILQTIQRLKTDDLNSRVPTLSANELLIALAISAVTNPTAQLAYQQLPNLKAAQAHSTVILNRENEQTLKKLGIDITNDPVYPTDNLYYN